MQGDNTSLSSAVNGWFDLLYSTDMENYRTQIKKRMENAIEPFFLVANWIDPLCLGMDIGNLIIIMIFTFKFL